MTRKTIFAIIAIASVAGVLGTSSIIPAFADEPLGDCPRNPKGAAQSTDFGLRTISSLTVELQERGEKVDNAGNNDGYICLKKMPSGPVIIDNLVPFLKR